MRSLQGSHWPLRLMIDNAFGVDFCCATLLRGAAEVQLQRQEIWLQQNVQETRNKHQVVRTSGDILSAFAIASLLFNKLNSKMTDVGPCDYKHHTRAQQPSQQTNRKKNWAISIQCFSVTDWTEIAHIQDSIVQFVAELRRNSPWQTYDFCCATKVAQQQQICFVCHQPKSPACFLFHSEVSLVQD